MKEKELEKTFKALGNRRRLAIILFLRKNKKGNVGEIAEAIKLSFRSTSRHLSVLISIGVLDVERLGTFSIYSIASDQTDILKKILGSF
jgi:DNA-binding transcriptional ArsR family regulator